MNLIKLNKNRVRAVIAFTSLIMILADNTISKASTDYDFSDVLEFQRKRAEQNLITVKPSVESIIEDYKNTESDLDSSIVRIKYKNKDEEEDYESLSTIEIDVPGYEGFKSYESYRAISPSSKQGRLQQMAETDEYGFRIINERYCVAVGTGISSTIGQYLDVCLESGEIIPCVVGDVKSNVHTESSNIMTMHSRCVTEFIVDTHILEWDVKRSGSASNHDGWNYKVKSITVLDQNAFDIEEENK